MALAVVAVIDASAHAVRFTITGGSGSYVLDASPAGGARYRVRSMLTAIVGDPTGRTGVDGDIPLNTPTTYIVTDAGTGSQFIAGPLTVDSAVPLLSDALDPTRVVAVAVRSQMPNGWDARSVWWDVLGTRAPFVSVAPLRYRSGPLTLYVADRVERDAVLGLLASGVPFVLRSPCPDAVDDVIGLPSSIREEPVIEGADAGARLLTIDYQAVSRELGPYAGQGGRTYAIALSESASYDVVVSTYETYADWLSGVPS